MQSNRMGQWAGCAWSRDEITDQGVHPSPKEALGQSTDLQQKVRRLRGGKPGQCVDRHQVWFFACRFRSNFTFYMCVMLHSASAKSQASYMFPYKK
jgi:hypothetical protein